MYEKFYGFREKPFSLLPDPGFLYFSKQHRMALALLEYGLVNQAGFTVITGSIGTGKTTLIRHLLNNIDHDMTVGLISNTHRSFGELLHWILQAYDIDTDGKSKVDMFQSFTNFIIAEYARGKRTVLIIDEAQNMSAETLEELRMLSNINADKSQVLQVVLVGQRQLRETLRSPDMIQFAQRIVSDYHIKALNEQETIKYISHRLHVAGGEPDIFSSEACRAVYQHSGGVPRLINLLCDTALVCAFADESKAVSAELVIEIAEEKQRGGLFPTPETMEADLETTPAEPEAVSPTENTSPDDAGAGLSIVERAASDPLSDDVPDNLHRKLR